MFKALRYSLKKSRLLSKIRKASEGKGFDALGLLDSAMKESVSGKELYTEELLSLLSEDEGTSLLLIEWGIGFADLRNMISILKLSGAGQIVNGHYVPVSAIAFLDTLNLLCSCWNEDGFDIEGKTRQESNQIIALKMLQSF